MTTGNAEHKPGAKLPGQVVEMLLAGIADDRFYIICPDDETTSEMDNKRILWAAQDITETRPPLSRWHPDFAEIAKQACSQSDRFGIYEDTKTKLLRKLNREL